MVASSNRNGLTGDAGEEAANARPVDKAGLRAALAAPSNVVCRTLRRDSRWSLSETFVFSKPASIGAQTSAGNYRLSHRPLTILIFARPSGRGGVSLLFGFDRDNIAREALKSHVCPSLVQ
jgi:hypothetical protein